LASGAARAVDRVAGSPTPDDLDSKTRRKDRMATRVIAGKEVQVNDEGFMTDATEWNKDIAAAIAAEEGIPELTADHWTVIDWARDTAKNMNWKSPTIRQITTSTGVNTKQLFALFPKGPAKKVARVAGLGKPEGCV